MRWELADYLGVKIPGGHNGPRIEHNFRRVSGSDGTDDKEVKWKIMADTRAAGE